MSETVHYRGTLKVCERFENESLELQCKRILENKELPDYYDDYKEMLMDTFYREYIVLSDILYSVDKKEVNPYDGIFNAHMNDDGDIEFEVQYYNGGCEFDEAIEDAIKNMKRRTDND